VISKLRRAIIAATMSVSLREITAQTVRGICGLSVGPDQQRFVASNAISLAEALFNEEAWYRAIYHDDSPAGFVMLYDESLRSTRPANLQVGLWRFMIDRNLQGQGIGAAALDQVIAHVRGKGLFTSLLVSYVPGPGCPEGFYLRAGFQHTGKVDDGEVVLQFPLTSNAP
jgi:diamine N-acetyltransferase